MFGSSMGHLWSSSSGASGDSSAMPPGDTEICSVRAFNDSHMP